MSYRRRVAKKVNGQVTKKWLYADGLMPVAELDSTGSVEKRYGPGYIVKNDTTYRVIKDHLGSVRMVVNIRPYLSTGDAILPLPNAFKKEMRKHPNIALIPSGLTNHERSPEDDAGAFRTGKVVEPSTTVTDHRKGPVRSGGAGFMILRR